MARTNSKPFMVFEILFLNLARPNSWEDSDRGSKYVNQLWCPLTFTKKKRKEATTSSSTPDNQCASNHLTAEVFLGSLCRQPELEPAAVFSRRIMLPVSGWQIIKPAFGGEKKVFHSLQTDKCFPLYSTDLNTPSEPIDIGRDPSFSFYIGPAAILRINSILAPLLYRLRDRGKTNTGIVKSCFRVYASQRAYRCGTMRRAWLMFHVNVVMVLFWGSTMESSIMYAELAMCFGR